LVTRREEHGSEGGEEEIARGETKESKTSQRSELREKKKWYVRLNKKFLKNQALLGKWGILATVSNCNKKPSFWGHNSHETIKQSGGKKDEKGKTNR